MRRSSVWKTLVVDIKPGDFLASGGVKSSDGKIHAIEGRIFPEALRGIGEGQRPWDVKPDGVMTNATVGNVTQSTEGGVVHVTYKDGQSEFTVGPEVPVLAYVAGDRGLLKPGSAAVTVAQKKIGRYPDNRPGDRREKRRQAADVKAGPTRRWSKGDFEPQVPSWSSSIAAAGSGRIPTAPRSAKIGAFAGDPPHNPRMSISPSPLPPLDAVGARLK